MKKNIVILFLSATALLISQALWAQSVTPDDYIAEASQAMLETSAISDPDARKEALNNVLDQYFDLSVVSQGVVGSHRDTLNAEQMARFEIEFQTALAGLMFIALESVGEFEMDIDEPQMRDENRGQVLVEVKTQSQGDLDFLFSLVRDGDNWNVANLIVSGVNLGLTYRNQFNELMLNNNNDADLAIDEWSSTVSL